MGMDSMTVVDIKQTLEREFEIYLTPQEIRNLTFASLDELSAEIQFSDVNKGQVEGTNTVLF